MAEGSITKTVLADALRELLQEHPFADITIGDICNRCGMNRKSFYYHFRDKYDLVIWIFYTDFFDSFLLTEDSQDMPDTLQSLCIFLEQHQPFYRAVLKVEGQNSLQDYLLEMLRPIISHRLEHRFRRDPDMDFYVDLHTALWRTEICRWVQEGCKLPSARFVRLMYNASASISDTAP